MMYDAKMVKERVSLRGLFEKDGHVLKRSGSALVCRCPVHEEKTSSCHVHEDEGFFKCFGCDFKGDIFVYWQKTRGVDFKAAMEALAALAGLSGPASQYLENVPKPAKAAEPEPMAPALTPERHEEWVAACAALGNDEAQVARIAAWRGYSTDTVLGAAEACLMGLVDYHGEVREAFLVERPDVDALTDGNALMAVGWHIRLGPATKGNEHPRKASWRYPWSGIGSWPFVMGCVAKAKAILFTEGQWDALALADLMGYAKPGIGMPKGVAIVGMRGATSWKMFLKHYSIPEGATGFLIGDADAAGKTWLAPDGFVERLRPLMRRVWCFFPAIEGMKDFNDIHKARLITREQLSAMLRERMRRPRMSRGRRGDTFLKWCKGQALMRSDQIGMAAYLVVADKQRPKGSGTRSAKVWERHWERSASAEHLPWLRAAFAEWRAQRHLLKGVTK